ncbi:Voltage-gated potassium channel subunit beta [Fasciolopsis buskii]|uniref:Voltage-gated potassium channel subunit beta n=1 Tax=Fasciolopsis buskii TaxID=27845 RepID=A0A8E0VLX8_9TREM|nr:Voltage-gated potassium channel subunit beta [Fasciolopsis buski]
MNPVATMNLNDTNKFVMPYSRHLMRSFCFPLGSWAARDCVCPPLVWERTLHLVSKYPTRAEITLGKILKNQKWRRSSYIISVRISRGGTAITEQGLSRKHIVEGLQSALERLQLEYVDILLVTRHPEFPNPIEEVVRTCTYLIEKGWAFYWGTSKWSAAEIMQAQSIARQFNLMPSALDQSDYNMLQRDFLQHAQEMSTKLSHGLITGSPLAGGLLTGKYLQGVPAYSRASLKGQTALLDRVVSSSKARNHSEQIRQLVNLANRIQCTCAQLAIGKYTYIYIYVCVCACAHYLLLNSTATSEQIDFCH